MLAATKQVKPRFHSLHEALQRLTRPAVGFHHPDDVVKDPDLSLRDKNAILASWACDACAVEDQPQMRWFLGSPEPVPLFEVMDAMARLQRKSMMRR